MRWIIWIYSEVYLFIQMMKRYRWPRKRTWLAVLIIFSVGWWFGEAAAPQVRIEKHMVTKTKTVKTKGDTVYQKIYPDSCKKAVVLAARRANAAEMIDAASAAQLDIISKARTAVAAGNSKALNDLDTAQRKLQGETVKWVLEMSGTKEEYKRVLAECEQETR